MISETLESYSLNIKQVYTATTDNGANMLRAVKLIEENESQALEESNTEKQQQYELVEEEESVGVNEQTADTEGNLLTNLEEVCKEIERDIKINIEYVDGGEVFTGMRCVAHTLQLAVLDALKAKETEKLLCKVRALVRKLRNPTYLYLMKKEKLKVPILDCTTRWHSAVDMLIRLTELKPFISDLMQQDSKIRELQLTPLEWEHIQSMIEVLLPCKILTKRLQDEQLTITDFFGHWLTCKIQVQSKKGQFAKHLLEYIRKREESILDNDVLLSGILLDPRFNFILTEDQLTRAISHLKKLWHRLNVVKDTENCDVAICRESPVMNTNENEIQDELGKYLNAVSSRNRSVSVEGAEEPTSSESKYSHIEAIIRNFRYEQKKIDHKANILKYWKSIEASYPELSQLAQAVFGVPATQTSVERLFSGLKFILSPYRSTISSSHLDDQIIVRANRIFDRNIAIPMPTTKPRTLNPEIKKFQFSISDNFAKIKR